jgi:hypothetical protein
MARGERSANESKGQTIGQSFVPTPQKENNNYNNSLLVGDKRQKKSQVFTPDFFSRTSNPKKTLSRDLLG